MARYDGLRDKVVVVTGGGSGIGLATVMLAARAGAILAVNDLDEARSAVGAATAEAEGARCVTIPGDVSDREIVARSIDAVIARFGRIDVLINNAGVATSAPAADYPLWDRMLAVNLSAQYYWAREAAVKSMLPRGQGSIVNVASVCAIVAIPGDVGYVAAKHGVIGLTKALAIEWARQGVRVNCVCPGFTETPILAAVAAVDPDRWDGRRRRIPIGRGASADEQARSILFLASDEGSYCTGAVLVNDGGQTSLSSGWAAS